MPSYHTLLGLPEGYTIHSVVANANQVVIEISSTAESAVCPCCQVSSAQFHSHYQRTLTDVACGQRSVVFHVRTHRWRCGNPRCQRQIFAERLTAFAPAWSRITTRLQEALQAVGVALNGAGGARLAQHLGIRTSATTLLRQVKALPDPLYPPPVAIGLDDWSFRRGRRFGTIIVDLLRHQVIDLLPDRDCVTVARWLAAHPSIRLISRDRSKEFAKAIRQGAPQAIQVLDRFHLLKNLVEDLPAILGRTLADLRPVPHHDAASGEDRLWQPVLPPRAVGSQLG